MYQAIDKLALLLPDSVYAKVVEKLHPHVPSVSELQNAFKGLSAAHIKEILRNTRELAAYCKAVEEAAQKVQK
jgi:hypothetical protein